MEFFTDKKAALVDCKEKNPAFVKEITVPEGITHIKAEAFARFKNVERIALPRSCKGFDREAIKNKFHLREIIMPSVEVISENSFYGCAELTELTLPATVRVIGPYAFANARGLKKLVFESLDKLEEVDLFAFRGIAEGVEIVLPKETAKPVVEYKSTMGEYSFSPEQAEKLRGKNLMQQAQCLFLEINGISDFRRIRRHAGTANGFFDDFLKIKAFIKDGELLVGYVIDTFESGAERKSEAFLLFENTVPYGWQSGISTTGDNNGAGYKGAEETRERTYITLLCK